MWISGLINPYGTPAQLIQAVAAGAITAVATPHLLDELAGVLARPKMRRWITETDATALIERLKAIADIHPDEGSPPRRVRDPKDDYLAALTETTGAVLVTGDADLLDADLTPPAITPRQLLSTIDWTPPLPAPRPATE